MNGGNLFNIKVTSKILLKAAMFQQKDNAFPESIFIIEYIRF